MSTGAWIILGVLIFALLCAWIGNIIRDGGMDP